MTFTQNFAMEVTDFAPHALQLAMWYWILFYKIQLTTLVLGGYHDRV